MADLHIIEMVDADPSEPQYHHDAVISLANHLLSEFNIQTQVFKLEDISSALFVVLFESLFSDKLPGIIRQPSSREDEIHNCQIVIDVLSTDVVRDNLSHIRGVNIVAGDVTAIANLLDVFSYLTEYVHNVIESDVPTTDNDDTRSLVLSEPDVGDIGTKPGYGDLSAKMKTGIPKQDRSKVGSALSNKANQNGGKISMNGKREGNLNTNESSNPSADIERRKVIRHEDLYQGNYCKGYSQRPPSPIRPEPDDSQSLLGQKTIDSEFSIDNWDKKQKPSSPRASPKLAWDEKSEQKSDLDLRDRKEKDAGASAAAAITGSSASEQRHAKGTIPKGREHADIFSKALEETLSNVSSFSASLPTPKRDAKEEKCDPLRSTVGPISYHSRLTPEKPFSESKDVPVKGFSSSLDDLRHLVEKTAALTRIALNNSPVRAKTERELDVTDTRMDAPRPTIPSETVRLAKELNARGLSSAHDEALPPNRGGKKVAFAESNFRSEYERSSFDEDHLRRPLTSLPGNRYKHSSQLDYNNDPDSDYYLEETNYRRQINNKDIAYGDLPMRSKPKSKSTKGKTPSLVTHLARNRQPELGAAHMTLKTENRAMQRKQEILKKMYDEDLDEFHEEVQHMLDMDAKKSQDTEQLFKKSTSGLQKKKVTKKAKGNGTTTSCKKQRMGKSGIKPKNRSANNHPVAGTPPLKIESEEDLLPALLEQFPHLHISEHTWHELWRHNLHRIEALTKAYNDSQRKKSLAQNQLEDAAHRHELLGDIVKKEIDHTKRLRDLKEQKQLQIQIRNKSHEKRMQSARARKYYNEYQVRARGKQLKKRTNEEMVFRGLFKEALDIQKDRIKDIRQYASDQRKRQESRRQNEIDSMENYYRDQFDMLTDRLSRERQETQVRDSAQQKMLEQMKRELRKKMESQIKVYQEQLFRDDDDAHWRQMDADRVKQQLHLARYSAKI